MTEANILKLVFDFSLPSQKCIKVQWVLLKNNDAVERHGALQRLCLETIPYESFPMIKWLIINVSSWFFFTTDKTFVILYHIKIINIV